MKTNGKFDEWVEAYLDDALSRRQRKRLLALLEDRPDLRREFLDEIDFSLRLSACMAEADPTLAGKILSVMRQDVPNLRLAESVRAIIDVRRRRSHWISGLAMAAVALAVLGAFLFRKPASPPAVAVGWATVESSLRGFVYERHPDGSEIGPRALNPGDVIREGMRIETRMGGNTVFAFDGATTRVDLSESSILTFMAGKVPMLDRGRLEASVELPRAGTPFVLTTPHARVDVAGTRFGLIASDRLTRLSVASGEVDFTDVTTGGSARVTQGQGAIAAGYSEIVVFPQPVSDGLVALYLFREHGGTIVQDVSGTGRPMNLTIANPEKVEWLPDRLRITGAANLTWKGHREDLASSHADWSGITVLALTHYGHGAEQGQSLYLKSRIGGLTATWDLSSDFEGAVHTASVLGNQTGKLGLLTYTQGRWMDFQPMSEVERNAMFQGRQFEMVFAPALEAHDRKRGFHEWHGEVIMLAIYARALTPEEIAQSFLQAREMFPSI